LGARLSIWAFVWAAPPNVEIRAIFLEGVSGSWAVQAPLTPSRKILATILA
jgi:hypothetical protein